MALGEQVTRGHLAVTANLLALGLKVLLTRLAVEAKLLAIRSASVDSVHLALVHPRLTLDALRRLMPFDHAGLPLDALRRLMPFDHAGLSLDALRARLLPLLYTSLAFDPLRRLMTLGALDALRMLGPRLLALCPLGRSELLTFHARRTLRALFAALGPLLTALSPLSLLSATVALLGGLAVLATSVRPRTRRGCDRQRGNAGCEKNPGHN